MNYHQWQSWFALDGDFEQKVHGILAQLVESIGAEKMCVVSLTHRAQNFVYCSKEQTCATDKDREHRELLALTCLKLQGSIETGQDLAELTSLEEWAEHGATRQVFTPIMYQEKVYGALYCIFADSVECTAEFTEELQTYADMLAVLFYNDLFYQGHVQPIKELLKVLDEMEAHVYISDVESRELLFVNHKMRQEYGLSAGDIGKTCSEVLGEGGCESCPLMRLGQDPYHPYVWIKYEPKSEKYYRATHWMIEWLDGRTAHLQYAVDITEERNINEDLNQVKLELEKANQVKTDFLSRMSHEIRTPINAIIGMARIAKSANDLNKIHQCVERIDASSKQLRVIVDDVLDMSKIQSDQLRLYLEPFDFERMLINLANATSTLINKKQQKLHICMDLDMPRYYRGDEFRLSQVISNLLSNAVKFTPEFGKVYMDISEERRAGKISTIQVAVSDTGIGIPEKFQESLFVDTFEQADGGTTRRHGGIGLGLVISKRIVELMDGVLTFRSQENEGSTFVFTVNLEVEENQNDILNVQKIDISNLRVLLMDDEVETRAYFATIMNEFRVGVDTADRWQAGLNQLEQADAKGAPYHIVFLSWQMPDSSLEALRALKKRFDSVRVVLITNQRMRKQAEDAISAGADCAITKPLFPSVLLDTIHQVIGLTQNRSGVNISNRYSFVGYTVLLAEDLDINRRILTRYLEETRMKVEHAKTGRQVVELFQQNPQRYDLILMDIHMPEMDGHEAARRIRAMANIPRAAIIPIVAMTAESFVADIDRCLQSGMNDHLTKPVKPDSLLLKLRYYLTRYEEELTDTEREPGKTTQGVEEEMATDSLEQYIKLDEALARLKDNKTLYKTLLNTFRKSTYWDQLQRQIADQDFAEAAKTAHAIKGMSANLSLVEIYQKVALLESQLKSGFDFSETLAQLEHAMEQTTKYIKILAEKL